MKRSAILACAITGCLGLVLGITSSRIAAQPATRSDPAKNVASKPAELTGKQKLIATMLEKLQIPQHNNMAAAYTYPMLSGSTKTNTFTKWLCELMEAKLGWETESDAVIEYYGKHLTEEELKEVIEILEKPVMKKVLALEVPAFQDNYAARAKRQVQFWQDYNENKFQPPPEVMKKD